MTSNLPQDDREARKAALERIAVNRQAQLKAEADRRAKMLQETEQRNERQQEAVVAEAGVAAEKLEARDEFIADTRQKKRDAEAERKRKLEEERLALEKKRKAEEEEKVKKEYMGELHDKAVRKKIETRREAIAHEEEVAVKEADNHLASQKIEINAHERQKRDHLEKEYKRASMLATADRDKAKAIAEDKKRVSLSMLKDESFEKERETMKLPEKQRVSAVLKVRQEVASKKSQIERDCKAACTLADSKWEEGEKTRKMELQKMLQEAAEDAKTEESHAEHEAGERKNEAQVRKIGEEQWLLGKDE